MSTVIRSIIITFGALIAGFIVWKKLREDYSDSPIFSLSYIIFFVELAVLPVVNYLWSDGRFWISIIIGTLVGLWQAKRYGIRQFEILEALAPGFFIFLLFVFAATLFTKNTIRLIYPAEFLLAVLSLGIFIFVSKTFRRYAWYTSGKIGIAAMLSFTSYGLGRASLAFFYPTMLFFSSPVLDIVLGIAFSVLCLWAVYIRSGRGIRHEFRLLRKK